MSHPTAVRWSIPVFFGILVVVPAVAANGEDVSLDNPDPGARPALSRDGRVFAADSDRRRLAEMWSADLRLRRIAANERETAAWKQVRTREDWETYRDQRTAALQRSLGQELQVPADLKVTISSTV